MELIPKQMSIINIFLFGTLLFISILSNPIFAQNEPIVIAYGKLKVEWGNQEFTKITLFENGKEVEKFYPKNNGKFEFSLKLNHEYIFWFEKSGYVTKKVDFNTNVPAEVLNSPDFEPFPDFDFNVVLFKSYPDVDTMFFTKPVGKIRYEAGLNDFDYDKEYSLEIVKRMEEIEADIKRRNEQEDLQSNKKEKSIQEKPEIANKNIPELDSKKTLNNLELSQKVEMPIIQPENETKNPDKPLDKSEVPSTSIQKASNNKQLIELERNTSNPVVKNKAESAIKKSISETQEVGKIVTRIEVTDQNSTLIYIKVVYTWGGKFFFIQDETNQFRNISENYFNIMVANN